MASGALTASSGKQATIRELLRQDGIINAIGRSLPKHMDGDRMARIAMTAITKTPKLAECDQGSFMAALLTLSQWGLEPDGYHAHLIPFENKRKRIVECQLIVDYKGMVVLAHRSGMISTVHTDVVRAGDIFEYSAGEVVRHVPHFLRTDSGKPKSAGEVFAVYCKVTMRNGGSQTVVMSVEEVNKIRDASQGYRAAKQFGNDSSPWIAHWNEMAKKTAFRRVAKWIPFSSEIVSVFAHEEAQEAMAGQVVEGGDDTIAALIANDGPTLDTTDSQVEPESTPEPAGEVSPFKMAIADLAKCKTQADFDRVTRRYKDVQFSEAETFQLDAAEREAKERLEK